MLKKKDGGEGREWCAQTVIKIVNGGCWGLSGRQAQKEWLVWGSDSAGRCASRAPGGLALLQD